MVFPKIVNFLFWLLFWCEWLCSQKNLGGVKDNGFPWPPPGNLFFKKIRTHYCFFWGSNLLVRGRRGEGERGAERERAPRDTPIWGVRCGFWLLRGRECRAFPSLHFMSMLVAHALLHQQCSTSGPPALACPRRPTCPARRCRRLSCSSSRRPGRCDLGAPVNAHL